MQIDLGHRLNDVVEAIARVELLDLLAELELLEDAPDRFGEAVDVGDEIRRDVLAVAEQFLERVGADVVERLLAVLVDYPGQQARDGVLGRIRGDEPLVLREHGLLGRLQHAIEAAQHDHRKHDEAVLRWSVRSAQAVRDFPNRGCNRIMLFGKQFTPSVPRAGCPARAATNRS